MLKKYPITSENGNIYYVTIKPYSYRMGYRIRIYKRKIRKIPFLNKTYYHDKSLYEYITSWDADEKYEDNYKELTRLAVESFEYNLNKTNRKILDKEKYIKEFKEWDGTIKYKEI